MDAVIDVLVNLFYGIDLEKVLGSVTGYAKNHDFGSIIGIIGDFYGGLFN